MFAHEAVPNKLAVTPAVVINEPVTSTLPENDNESKSNEILSAETSNTEPEFTAVDPDKIKEPDMVNTPIEDVEFDVTADSMLCPVLPDLWI